MPDKEKTAVVVVDDEPPIVEVVCDVLEDEGFRTVPCKHGREAFVSGARSRSSLFSIFRCRRLMGSRSFSTCGPILPPSLFR